SAIHEEAEGGKQILQGIASIRDATGEVQKQSQILLEGSIVIQKAMAEAKDLTALAKSATSSIAENTKELHGQIEITSKSLVENDENIGIIEKGLSIFKTK
ncbi:MAG: hypothetical protein FWC45_01715, partial [Treponema sp.]|nr:hypothetical protein [Treponema sp.]